MKRNILLLSLNLFFVISIFPESVVSYIVPENSHLLPWDEIDLRKRKISLEDLKIKEIFQVIDLSKDSIVIVGRRDEISSAMVLVDLATGKHETLSVFSDADYSFVMSGDQIFLQKLKPRSDSDVICLVAVYFLDHSGMKVVNTETKLQVFLIAESTLLNKTPTVTIAKQDIWYECGPSCKWAVSSNEGSSKPATKSDARLLLADVNSDGSLDIVIWKKSSQSILRSDIPNETDTESYNDFLLPGGFSYQGETLSVMLYDAHEQNFGLPVQNESLPKPEDGLWERMQSVGRVEVVK